MAAALLGRQPVTKFIKGSVLRIPAKANAIPKGSRTAFRAEGEHHRSEATLAFRLCKKCSASSRETIRSEAEAGSR